MVTPRMNFQYRRVLALLLWMITTFCALTPPASAADYTVVFEKSYRSRTATYGRVYSLIKTRDGGYAFSGRGFAAGAWVVKTDSDGEKEWEALIPGSRGSDQDAYVVMEAPDGGLAIGGRTNSHDLVPGDWGDDGKPSWPFAYRNTPTVAFAARFDRAGRLLWRKAYGPIGKFHANWFSCGAATADALIFVGKKTDDIIDQALPAGRRLTNAVWIVKVDLKGNILWERVIGEDQGVRLGLFYLFPQHCGGPQMDANGDLTVALGLGGQGLLLKLNKNGDELARQRIPDLLRPLLLPRPEGHLLVDHPLPLLQRGVRETWLDKRLAITEQRELKSSHFVLGVDAALASSNRGLHVVGEYIVPPNERGKPALAVITEAGEITKIRTLGFLFSDWGEAVALALGDAANELVLLRRGGKTEDVRLIKFKLEN